MEVNKLEFLTNQLTDIVFNLYKRVVINLPSSYLEKFADISNKETNETAIFIFDVLKKNIEIARDKNIPICQDTGIPVFFIEIGQDLKIIGDIEAAINDGVKKACVDGFIRASVCDPLTRKNTLSNTPSVIHTKLVKGNIFRISLVPKGCGSENMSAISMLSPSQGEEGIISFILNQVKKAGPNPCPPMFLGVGIGGTLEEAAMLSKKALIFDNKKSISPHFELEKRIFQEINKLHIGPMGLGGDYTCSGVKVLTSPCHIASLPVSVNIQCHAARSITAEWKDDKWVIPDDDKSLSVIPSKKMPVSLKMKSIDLPFDLKKLSDFNPGEWVLLSGELITARDQTLMKLFNDMDNNITIPYDFRNSTIYLTGPSPAQSGNIIGSCGPTSSYRMKPFIERLINVGVLSLIGKGFSPVISKGMVYFATIGGAGAYLSEKIVSCETIAYSELGPEAILKLQIKDFPVVVIHSLDGRDLYV